MSDFPFLSRSVFAYPRLKKEYYLEVLNVEDESDDEKSWDGEDPVAIMLNDTIQSKDGLESGDNVGVLVGFEKSGGCCKKGPVAKVAFFQRMGRRRLVHLGEEGKKTVKFPCGGSDLEIFFSLNDTSNKESFQDSSLGLTEELVKRKIISSDF